jgi:hypothetical protein
MRCDNHKESIEKEIDERGSNNTERETAAV